MRVPALVLLALLTLPAVAAQAGNERIDVRITVTRDGEPAATGEGVRVVDHAPGEHARFALNLTRNYTTFEARVSGWDVERARQVLPLLHIDRNASVCAERASPCDYPLFDPFPHERVWDVDGPARVFFTSGAPGEVVLRLGVPGPVNATLVLQRDVTPPTFVVRPPQNVTDIGFYQETTTAELALADLQVRAVGEEEWVQNPTPMYHYLQKFPVQGLDADTEHEARVVFTDWSGNEATSPTYRVRTLPEPQRPIPLVTPLSPEPNATVPREGLVVRARFTSNESPVPAPGGVRLFFDKREVTADVGLAADEVAYVVPGPLDAGTHSVSVEVTNEAGGRGIARWTFEVGGSRVDAAPWAALAGLALAAVAATRRR